MSVAAGACLCSYEVVAQFGAGGMGEVDRARDTKLGREVAIRVLLANFVNDPERLSRFHCEARMPAALIHAIFLENLFDEVQRRTAAQLK